MRILALICIVLFSSCSGFKEARRVAKCKKFDCIQEVKTVIKDSVVYRDTTLYITQKGAVEYIENPCSELCDSFGNLKPFKRETRQNGIKTIIKTIDNTLVVECDVDSLKAIITGLRDTYHSEVITEVVTPKKDSKWKIAFDLIKSVWFFLSFLGLFLYIGYKTISISKIT